MKLWFWKVKYAIILLSTHSVYIAARISICVTMAFGGPGDGCRLDTDSETVLGQIFTSFIFFCGLGFIHEYSENLYTAKISN